MRVFRADGAWVANLVDRAYGAGTHRVTWDGRDASGAPVASGPYIVRLQADGIAESIKMMLVR
jgi:flagellar hook assembly protein FlgD